MTAVRREKTVKVQSHYTTQSSVVHTAAFPCVIKFLSVISAINVLDC